MIRNVFLCNVDAVVAVAVGSSSKLCYGDPASKLCFSAMHGGALKRCLLPESTHTLPDANTFTVADTLVVLLPLQTQSWQRFCCRYCFLAVLSVSCAGAVILQVRGSRVQASMLLCQFC